MMTPVVNPDSNTATACATRSAGFSRAQRVRKGADFTRCFANGTRLSGAAFRLHVRFAEPSDPLSTPARLGLAVSRRVDKRAVGRNRLKRIARDSFRHRCAALPAADYVLVAKAAAAAMTAEAVRIELTRLWQRAAALALKPILSPGTMPASPPPPAIRFRT